MNEAPEVGPAKSKMEIALADAHKNSQPGNHTEFYGRRNARRFLNFGGTYIEWRDKAKIQFLVNQVALYIKQLEDECKRLVQKNNDIISGEKQADAVDIVDKSTTK